MSKRETVGMECWLFGARNLCQWGPSGGDGCRGWNASVEVGGSMNSSFPFRNIVYYSTGRGVHGARDEHGWSERRGCCGESAGEIGC